jgi:dihydropteroate synthase
MAECDNFESALNIMQNPAGTQFSSRPAFDWLLPRRTFALGRRTLVMAVLNVTPDSFSDGGLFLARDEAVAQALRMIDEGADILDIGGESTRPGKRTPESAATELERVLPVIEAVLQARPSACISIDTYKAETARRAVDAGAEIVNDISGFTWDADIATACAQLDCGIVLMHSRGRPAEWRALPPLTNDEVVPLVFDGLQNSLQLARDAGITESRIVLDPGYGFGKSFDENYPLIAHLGVLEKLGRPLLAGTSRKSFHGRTLSHLHDGKDAPVEQRLYASIASTTAAILAGAHIVRVHDVRPAVEAAAIADAILASSG